MLFYAIQQISQFRSGRIPRVAGHNRLLPQHQRVTGSVGIGFVMPVMVRCRQITQHEVRALCPALISCRGRFYQRFSIDFDYALFGSYVFAAVFKQFLYIIITTLLVGGMIAGEKISPAKLLLDFPYFSSTRCQIAAAAPGL